MSLNSTPRNLPDLIGRGIRARAAIIKMARLLDLKFNTAEVFSATLNALAGCDTEAFAAASDGEIASMLGATDTDSLVPASQQRGAQPELLRHNALAALSRKEHREMIAESREFCRVAVYILKPRLGHTWNAAWDAVGFSRGSLAIPQEPAVLLSCLRDYLSRHPEHESPQFSITPVGSPGTELEFAL